MTCPRKLQRICYLNLYIMLVDVYVYGEFPNILIMTNYVYQFCIYCQTTLCYKARVYACYTKTDYMDASKARIYYHKHCKVLIYTLSSPKYVYIVYHIVIIIDNIYQLSYNYLDKALNDFTLRQHKIA